MILVLLNKNYESTQLDGPSSLAGFTQLNGLSKALHGALPGIRQVISGSAVTVAAAVTAVASGKEEDGEVDIIKWDARHDTDYREFYIKLDGLLFLSSPKSSSQVCCLIKLKFNY